MRVNNILLEGLRGKLGDKVYRLIFGHTDEKSACTHRYNVNGSDAQKATQNKFKEAHLFAQGIIADPQLKAEYAARATGYRNAYTQAMSEYLSR